MPLLPQLNLKDSGTGLLWIAGLLAVGAYAYLYVALPESPAAPVGAAPSFEWVRPGRVPADDWDVFRRTQGQTPSSRGPLGRRFRLAGTFFAFSDAAAAGTFSKAILDDLAKKEQRLVAEGETIEDAQVVRILRDRIVLRSGGQEEELWLSFSDAAPGARPATGAVAAARAPAEMPALEVNRFGKRVGETRWVLSREALMSYYQELLDDPERLAAVYVSMKPEYKDGAIAGYDLDVAGEADFFKAAGMLQGDVVRKVNSMNMTSQNRAEYFIREFVNNRVSAVVLDIERGGQPKKLIYLIR
jgi:type II secretory pathway component PulC